MEKLVDKSIFCHLCRDI